MANPKWHHCVLHPMNVDPRKKYEKVFPQVIMEAIINMFTIRPLIAFMQKGQVSRCFWLLRFIRLPVRFTLGHHGPHHGHLARKKQQAFGYLAPVFCEANLFLHLFLVEMNHGKQTSFWFAVCCGQRQDAPSFFSSRFQTKF